MITKLANPFFRFRSKPTRPPILLFLLAAVLVLAWILWQRPLPAPLPQAAYIWQRGWTDGVRETLRRNQPFVAEWAVLAAEIEFRPSAAPRAARAAVDYASLRESGRPVSLVIRVAPWAGPFDPERPETQKAARFDRPFQVALPTYGYRAWFDAQNRLLGLSAEGPDLTAAKTVKELTTATQSAGRTLCCNRSGPGVPGSMANSGRRG